MRSNSRKEFVASFLKRAKDVQFSGTIQCQRFIARKTGEIQTRMYILLHSLAMIVHENGQVTLALVLDHRCDDDTKWLFRKCI